MQFAMSHRHNKWNRDHVTSITGFFALPAVPQSEQRMRLSSCAVQLCRSTANVLLVVKRFQATVLPH
jgi:hypothetical protein